MLTARCVSAARKWSRPDVNQLNRVFLRISLRYGVPVPYQRPNPRRAAWGLQIEGDTFDRRLFRKAFSFEYIYHHLSNGYRAVQNPGVDSQMLCFGYVKVLTGS
jgi:hypothetical protein